MKDNFKNMPFWPIVSSVLFFAFLAALLFPLKTTVDGEEIISKEKAGEKVVEFINRVFLQGQDQVELTETSEESGVYKIKMMWDAEEIDSYVTRDGKFLFPEAFKMDEFSQDFLEQDNLEEIDEEIIIEENLEEQKEGTETEDSGQKNNVENLVSCLKDKNFVIYGADWCPYCRDLVDLFGGYEKAESIYVECTEKQKLCQEKNITSYPTILVNDQPYKGERKLESFALETQCPFN